MLKQLFGTRFYSIINQTCPACNEGECFETRNPYTPGKLTEMHEKCNKCHHRFEIETGFFYGAMYASYAISIAFGTAVFVAMAVLFPNMGVYARIGWLIAGLVIFAPVNFRLGRMVWMNLFTSYGRDKKQYP